MSCFISLGLNSKQERIIALNRKWKYHYSFHVKIWVLILVCSKKPSIGFGFMCLSISLKINKFSQWILIEIKLNFMKVKFWKIIKILLQRSSWKKFWAKETKTNINWFMYLFWLDFNVVQMFLNGIRKLINPFIRISFIDMMIKCIF